MNSGQRTSSSSLQMPIRLARSEDFFLIPSIFAAGFYDEEVVGVLLHPYREQYPQDYVAAWRRGCREKYWDVSTVFLVSYEVDQTSGKEVITGAAEWQRQGLGWEKVWGLWGRWDPSMLTPEYLVHHKITDTPLRSGRMLYPTRDLIYSQAQ